jgi:hypothetical protein
VQEIYSRKLSEDTVIGTENKCIEKLEKGTSQTDGWWVCSPFHVIDSNIQATYVPLVYMFSASQFKG